MRKFLLISFFSLALLCCCCFDASAELFVGLSVDYKSYLQYETIYVYVDILNDSDETFVIDADDSGNPCRLEFDVGHNGKRMAKIESRDLCVENLSILPDERRRVMIDLTKFYEVGTLGSYTISAIVRGRKDATISKRADIDIVPGFEIAAITKTAPGFYVGERKYSLLYWNRGGFEYLFLRVDAPEQGMNLGVVQLGTLIRVMQPKLEVDRKGNVTVIHQTRPTKYLRTKFLSDYQGLNFVDQLSVSDVVE